MKYSEFLARKRIVHQSSGIKPREPNSILFPFQRDIVKWALRRGKACIFADCGLGKTFMQIEWARQIPGNVLILVPLAVANQTIAEGAKLDCFVRYCRSQSEVQPGITIANYEMLEHFDATAFTGIVLDESSIIKHFEGKFRNAIIRKFSETPYRLACTATPAPNDHMELGNHAEFMGAMSRVEMLSMFFVHDGGETSKWRLKGHAQEEFWKWVCSWAVMLRKPSDLGYEDGKFIIPPMSIEQISVEHTVKGNSLFAMEAQTLSERLTARRESITDRVAKCEELILGSYAIKLAACGNRNTQRDGENVTKQTLLKGSGENHREDRRPRIEDICESITRPIPVNSRELSNSKTLSILDERNDTKQTRHLRKSADSIRGVETLTEKEMEGCDHNSESGTRIIHGFSKNRKVDAVFVEGERVTHEETGYQSTTVIEQIGSEDYCARTATLDLASFETIFHSSKVQSDIFEPWLVWCNLNSEQEALEDSFGGICVSITGALPFEEKISRLNKWLTGEKPICISKPSIIGFGINAQHCRNVAFVGLSDSWEQYYQAMRRCWRYGQTQEVRVHIITSSAEGQVVANIKRKEADANRMAVEMINNMHSLNEKNIKGTEKTQDIYAEDLAKGKNYELHLGDCVEVCKKLAGNSIGYSIFSPPFASLYTYSASERDMGNCKTYEEFSKHFEFLSVELFRVIQPGRLLSCHCMNLPTSKSHHGYIGLRDFRGDLIRCFQRAGFIFHSEVCIWKDPVTTMQRTKALGLLHKQMAKDSCMSRQGVPDYLVTMRKPGENQNPVEGELDRWIGDDTFRSEGRLSIDLWQRYASPVWMDINQSRTLQKDSARDEKDERHIAPLQLDVIERAMELWSNPGDLVLSPFAGIGSEGYVAILNGRRFIGAELKASYWKQACANLKRIECESQVSLFEESVA